MVMLEHRKVSASRFSVLIMCETRIGARSVSLALSRHPDLPFLKSDYAIGRSQSVVDVATECNSNVQIEKLLKREINCLVGTRVIQEGIDIPSCHLVIKTGIDTTATSLIQAAGRVRAQGGKFLALVVGQDHMENVQRAANMANGVDVAVKKASSNPRAIQDRNNLFKVMGKRKFIQSS
ncbi:hypothetical protein GEMRC1_011650 [Eukaryota sp. GEM-RC1]